MADGTPLLIKYSFLDIDKFFLFCYPLYKGILLVNTDVIGMSDEKCILNPVRDCLGLQKSIELEHRIDRNDKSIDNLDNKLNKHDQRITILETLVGNLKELPSAINNLEKTMVLMQRNLEILNVNVDSVVKKINESDKQNRKQDARIFELDNKSKIDILDFLKQNWWKICFGVASILYIFENIILK